jgi:hypothetical protein
MNPHPYLRAYMAGIVVPTLALLVGMTVFTLVRYVYDVPIPIERVIVFPMAVVPNLWGLWNILYVAFLSDRHVPIGAFGAALPFLLVPSAYLVALGVHFAIPAFVIGALPYFFPFGVIVYYLAWKYIVGSLNSIVQVA